jgi:hypothetical protein
MSQKSSDPQAISFVSQPLKRDTLVAPEPREVPARGVQAPVQNQTKGAVPDEGAVLARRTASSSEKRGASIELS